MRKLLPIILISAVTVAAYWQVAFFAYCMKWDMMDFFFPMRHFLASAWQAHLLPLWCPYQFLGNPFYADPQSGFWYPVDVLLAATVGYSVYTVQAEFILHLLLAGWGFYCLLRTLQIEVRAAAVAAALFPLTGFFVSNATHSSFVISAAWIPWVLYFFVGGTQRQKPSFFLLAGLALSLCLTGGYIALALLCGYSLVGIYIVQMWRRRQDRLFLKKITGYSFLSLLSFLLFSSGYIFSLLQALPLLKRAEGLGLSAVNVDAFTPASFLSFLFPFAVNAPRDLFDTDITMRNIYMGLALFPLLLVSLMGERRKRNALLLALGVFCLSVAVGKYLPVRGWLYYTVPLMDLFRHPALFRLFTIICFLIVAADGLQLFFSRGKGKLRKFFIVALLGEFAALLAAALFACLHSGKTFRFPYLFSVQRLTDFNAQNGVSEHVLAQFLIFAPLLLLLVLLLIFTKKKNHAWWIAAVWLTDVVAAVQLNVPGTVVCPVATAQLHEACKKLPPGFPLPPNLPVSAYNQYGGEALTPVVYNANLLRKELCGDGFSPFVLKPFTRFAHSPLAEKTSQNPPAFLSSSIRPLSALAHDARRSALYASSLYAEKGYGNSDLDSVAGTITWQLLHPNAMVITTETKAPAYLTLLQSYYPGWRCTVDGVPAAIIPTNYTFMTVLLPAGQHRVHFSFLPPNFYWIAGLSLFSYLLLLGVCVGWVRRGK